MEALLKELVDKIQSLEEKMEVKLTVMKKQLEEKLEDQTNQITELDEKLSKMKEQLEEKLKDQLEVQTIQITEDTSAQLDTKLRRLERQLQEQSNLMKYELLSELMILEQNLLSPQASTTVKQVTEETQITEETTDISTTEAEIPGTFKDVGVQVDLLPKEEEKRWEVCGERRGIQGAVCRRERAVVAVDDSVLEFYSSGKVVGRYLELEGRRIERMFCSDEYIGVMLGIRSMACFRWLSDRLEWLYCLYIEGQTWRKAKTTSDVPFMFMFKVSIYCQAQDVVCCLDGDQVSGWSLSREKTVFNIKVPGAKDLEMTPDLVLVNVTSTIKVFTLEGSNLYSIQDGMQVWRSYPQNNTNYTAGKVYLDSGEITIMWPTTSGNPVLKIEAFRSALHPHLPHICYSVKGKRWELVLGDISTRSVIWRRPQSGSDIEVFSIDSNFFLIKSSHKTKAPVEILRWSSGEVVATFPVEGYIKSTSPQYIVSNREVLYRELNPSLM